MSADAGTTTVIVTVDDAVVRCTLSGVDRQGTDPVVLLPGLGGSTEREFSFLRPLLARASRVLAVDLNYAAAAPADLAPVLGQLAAVLRQVVPGRRVTLVGFSVGATVAAAFAETSPEVASLVLVAPVLRASDRHRRVAALRSLLATGDPEALRSLDLFAAHSPSFLQARLPEPFAANEDENADTAAKHQLFVGTDLAESVRKVTVPTLVVGATQDDLAGIDQARMFFASLPNARYAEIDSGHAVLAERPAEVLALIREFAAHPLRHRAGSVLERARP
jgi:pimeloyl-ACP methyl ester carboxylesterase